MKYALVAAVCAAMIGGVAHAQMRAPDPDLNKDGKVTLAEFQKVQVDGMFSRLDADKNGKITKAETQTLADRAKMMGRPDAGQRLNAMFAMDADNDGALTRAECETGATRRFKVADANGDGWLSKTELSAMRQTGKRAD